jgi:hypothetical protein
LVGAAFYAAAALPRRLPEQKLLALILIDTAAAAAVFIISLLSARDAGTMPRRARIAFTPAFFTAASLGYFMLIETKSARYALAAFTIGLLSVYFIQLRKALHPFIPLTLVEFAHLSYAMHAISMFFTFAFTFGITSYIHIWSPILALALGLLGGIVALETFKGNGVASAAIGLLAAELQASLAFLPTSYMVNAAVAIILFVLSLHVFKHVLTGLADNRTIKRQFAFSTLLVVLVLATARWA